MAVELMAFDVDRLPPVSYLILDVLAARYRLGEQLWTFPSRLRPHLQRLSSQGLVGCKHGVAERSMQAWLTPLGREAVLSPTYRPPNDYSQAT